MIMLLDALHTLSLGASVQDLMRESGTGLSKHRVTVVTKIAQVLQNIRGTGVHDEILDLSWIGGIVLLIHIHILKIIIYFR